MSPSAIDFAEYTNDPEIYTEYFSLIRAGAAFIKMYAEKLGIEQSSSMAWLAYKIVIVKFGEERVKRWLTGPWTQYMKRWIAMAMSYEIRDYVKELELEKFGCVGRLKEARRKFNLTRKFPDEVDAYKTEALKELTAFLESKGIDILRIYGRLYGIGKCCNDIAFMRLYSKDYEDDFI